ncbi:hypothetical protein [Erythrobacter sp.]|uniref:hypothetical protein n=1 Tax=Erythrobacter sp. TaxID=1042 RepID=UPI0025ECDAC6|nr:hypothetical protein [Erythrobacter sp.]
MAGWRQRNAGKTDRSRATRQMLRNHRLFAPILGVWGAAAGGLCTLVLPQSMIFTAAFALGLGVLGGFAPFALAGLAALVMGAAMLLLARLMSRKAAQPVDAPSLATLAMRYVRTIDPVKELGSGSLDEPVTTQPFASLRPQAEPEPAAAPQDLPPPRALDLGEFAALAGRNAVWVDEPAPVDLETKQADPVVGPDFRPETAPAPAQVAEPAALRTVSPSAIERLRAVPPSDLSLIQMVERFAAAMHQHQAAAPQKGDRADLAGRDAALAEALKALAALSQGARADTHSEPLRAAIGRLQELRGAA